jgi:hypothetical protein
MNYPSLIAFWRFSAISRPMLKAPQDERLERVADWLEWIAIRLFVIWVIVMTYVFGPNTQ